jgi:hypothetical protein
MVVDQPSNKATNNDNTSDLINNKTDNKGKVVTLKKSG